MARLLSTESDLEEHQSVLKAIHDFVLALHFKEGGGTLIIAVAAPSGNK